MGLATPDHTPFGRGYQKSLTYLDGANDCEWGGTLEVAFSPLSSSSIAQSPPDSHLHPPTPPPRADYTSITFGYCTQKSVDLPFTDLWASKEPAYGQNNSWACSQDNQPPTCRYEDDIFTEFIVDAINTRDASKPMFTYFAPHNCHEPLEVSNAQLEKFAFISANCTAKQCINRQFYAAMTNEVDNNIGKVVAAIKAVPGMWDNTLIIV